MTARPARRWNHPEVARAGSAVARSMASARASAIADRLIILCGPASGRLGAAMADLLGRPVAKVLVDRFPDGEVRVEIGERVRDAEAVIVQSTAPPVNDRLMELLALADASRRAGAATVTAV